MKRWLWLFCALPIAASPARGDWPQWGHDNSRNMVSATEKGLPDSFDPGKPKEGKDEIDPATTKNVKWTARLGNQSYGNPTVAGGKVFLGTNNDAPRNPSRSGDMGVLMCFDEASGKFLWQLTVPKLAAGKASDFDFVGLCSSPTVEGDRIYIVTNRCEVLCLTTEGLGKKNEGPFQDEAKYVGGEVGPTDADIVWRYDMRDELGVFPHNMTSSAVLVLGDRLYVTTSNGTDWTNKHVPAPGAPALICLDKKTGRLLGEERSGISSRTFKSNWSSPAAGRVGDRELVIFGGGDGFCYAFDPTPVDGVLKEVWRCDCNPPSRKMHGDKPLKYGSDKGPSEIIATPVLVNGRVYVATGQDPESGEGSGALTCIDASKSGDITSSGKVWTYEAIGRSISTASVVDGLIYVADYTGVIHCVDAETGQAVWTHDTEGKTWASTLVADGKVYVGNEGGTFVILAAGREKKLLASVTFDGAVYGSTIVANGVLYVGTDKYLYAIQKK
jgi:outer membrane protein assembly factor BamB